jgi:carbon storage regulator CsrA
MLVLTRKMRESIAVGRADNSEPMLTVTVLDIGGGRVKLGFEGEATVSVHRWELWERIRAREQPDMPAAGLPPSP